MTNILAVVLAKSRMKTMRNIRLRSIRQNLNGVSDVSSTTADVPPEYKDIKDYEKIEIPPTYDSLSIQTLPGI